ncbi:MAG: hypothetical protein ABIM88_09110 [candidate division WOR-3 bacterium]
MDSLEKVKKGLSIYADEGREAYEAYLKELLREDQLAAEVLEVAILTHISELSSAVRKGSQVYRSLPDDPRLSAYFAGVMGKAYRMMGEIEASENYHLRDLEASEAIGDKDGVFRARTNLLHIRFCRGEYELLYKEIKSALKNKELPDDYYARYHLAFLEIIKGEPDKVLRIIKTLKHSEDKRFYYFGSIEIKGLALRLMGRLEEAMACYEESAEGMVRLGAAYSAFPCAKALELSRLAGLPKPPRRLISACLSLGVKGSWGEQAAAQAIQALNNPDNEKCCSMLFEAAGGYKRAYHLLEAFTSGLLSAQIAWQIESPLFAKILRFLAPLAPAHPGFRKDPLLGRFLTEIYPLLTSGSGRGNEHSIRAYLIGEMRVLVDGKEIPIGSWRRKKAARALVYLLLSPKHRLPQDHLFYLLWPRRKYDERSREGLYSVIYTIRKGIGRPELLTKRRDFYQLEDVWTDLDELELLIRKADAAQDTDDRVENLSLARSIAKDELLPEIIDDHYIEEYREYYNRLRRRIFSSSG